MKKPTMKEWVTNNPRAVVMSVILVVLLSTPYLFIGLVGYAFAVYVDWYEREDNKKPWN